MKYFAFYSFTADVYKKNPTIEIFIDNQLVDEHEIRGSIKDYLRPTRGFKSGPIPSLYNDVPLYVMEMDTHKENMKVEFKIVNTDNNYTNGFMTKNTLVNFWYFFLVSEKFIKNIDHVEKNYRYKWGEYEKNMYDIKKFYARHRIVEDLAIGANYHFDGFDPEKKYRWYSTGGDGSYVVRLKRKHWCWYSHNSNTKGIMNLGDTELLKFLSNKYFQYENL